MKSFLLIGAALLLSSLSFADQGSTMIFAPCRLLPSIDEVKQTSDMQSWLQKEQQELPGTCQFIAGNDNWQCSTETTNCENSTGPVMPLSCSARLTISCNGDKATSITTIDIGYGAVVGYLPGFETVLTTTTRRDGKTRP